MTATTAPAIPVVTVLIPAAEEEAHIRGCLEVLAGQDFGTARLEVILVDGISTDRTVAVAEEAADDLGLALRVLANPRRRTSVGLNVGLDAAAGRIVVRLDARSRIEPHYLSTCTRTLDERAEVGVVGGAQVAVAWSEGVVDAGIARALRNRWGTGLSRYRRSRTSGPSDTVWMGSFRTAELRGLGGWNGDVALNEDFDLNQRYRAAGWIVWFDASLRSGYLPRRSFPDLARQYFRFGRVKGTWWAREQRPGARQVALLAVPVVGFAGLASAARRIGSARAGMVAVAGALALDAAGGEAGDLRKRMVAAGALTVLSGSWWAGVVAGYLGERAGVDHELG